MEDKTNLDYIFESEAIDLREIFRTLWKKKLFIFLITLFTSIASVFYAISLPNIYTSTALLSSADDRKSLSSSLGGLSGLAGIAGLSLPGDNGNSSIEAMERVKSYSFFTNNFLPNINLEDLVAVKKWDQINNRVIYNERIYNEISKQWVRDVKPPKSAKPSDQDAYKKYKLILSINQSKKTGFVSLSIKHESPNIAKEWTEIIIEKINSTMRELDKQQATKSIKFLNESYKKNSIADIKESISKLTQEQMQKLMLTASSEEYVYKIIDAPIAPERKTSPSRAFICIFSTIFGLIASSLMVLILQYFKNSKY
jgi:LPS O-antigen subunit length determinant protein (WzzB/FepE family)